MQKSIIQEKSFAFAVRIVQIGRHLQASRREFFLSNQLLRSGTSIGANVEETLGGQSQKDFLAKMSIAAKEARETRYWLKLLRDSEAFNEPRLAGLLKECNEILSVLNSIILTTRQKLKTNTHNSSLRTHNSTRPTQDSELITQN